MRPLLLAAAALLAAAPAGAQTPDDPVPADPVAADPFADAPPPPDPLGLPGPLGLPEADPFAEAAAASVAPPPASFAFQGALSDGGAPVADGTYAVTVRLFDVAAGGTALYAEDHAVATTGGAFAVSVGAGTPVAGSFAAVNFSEAVWVEVAWGGTTLSPRTAVEPAPVARTLVAGAVVEGGGLSALSALNGAPDGVSIGLLGESASTSGRGVHGWTSAPGGTTYGVVGESASTSGRGVFGRAGAPSGATYGVVGESESTSGIGVRGSATATTGATYGVYGQSASTSGHGVFGWATTTDGVTYGVYGRSTSTSGRGVTGWATATSGQTYGVFGRSQSTSGRGVYGQASATSGSTYGVRGQSASTSGTGVYGEATAQSGTTAGVFGWSESTSGSGVYGRTSAPDGRTYGVFGQNASTQGTGVFGWATAANGQTYGVVGAVASPDGFAGSFLGGRGLRIRPSSLTTALDAALTNEGILLEDRDAVVGLYSTGIGTWGSALALGEVASGGALVNKWAVARRTGATGGLYFTFGTSNNYGANDAQMRIDTDGSVHADGSFTGGGADLAEFFPASVGAAVRPGDLVGLRGGRVSLAASGAEQVMVASTDPAFVGNPDGEAGGVLVALVGQAEVRLAGPASVGDLLVASGQDDGTARAVAPEAYRPGADGPVAGRVLSAPEAGRVVALVGVDEAAALRAVVARQAEENTALRVEMEALRAEVEALRSKQGARLDALARRLDALTAPGPAASAH